MNALERLKLKNQKLQETIKTPEGQKFLLMREKYLKEQLPIEEEEKEFNFEDHQRVSERQAEYFKRRALRMKKRVPMKTKIVDNSKAIERRRKRDEIFEHDKNLTDKKTIQRVIDHVMKLVS